MSSDRDSPSPTEDPFLRRLAEELAPELHMLRPLARSATAVVVLAREPALRRLVVVKTLAPSLADDERARLRFAREAQSAARTGHPGVVGVHRVGTLPDGLPYVVMPYVEGRSLAARLAAEGHPLPPAEVARILAQLASALASVHARRVVHRDVNPANVLVENETGRVLITDFGLAAVLASGEEEPERLTTAGHVVGDVRYASPERLRGEAVTPAADVYSLGLLGFELLTGRLPFEADSTAKLVAAHLTAEPRRLSELRPGVDPWFDDLLRRCLTKNPQHRPRAADVERELVRRFGGAAAPSPGAGATASRPRPPASAPEDAASRLEAGASTATPPSSPPPAPGPGPDHAFELRLLGGLELCRADGRRVRSVLAQPKRVALLAYLAIEAGRRFKRRDSVVGVFWPETEEEKGRHALRQALYSLRRSLDEDVFSARGDDELALAADRLWCDAVAFEGACQEGRDEEALALYRGPLLPGFYVPGAAGFERWLEAERGRLARLAGEAAWRLAEGREAAGDPVAAAHWARRASELSPFDETALRRLLELLERTGDRAGALRTYEEFARRLSRELDAEPAAETQELAGRIRDG